MCENRKTFLHKSTSSGANGLNKEKVTKPIGAVSPDGHKILDVQSEQPADVLNQPQVQKGKIHAKVMTNARSLTKYARSLRKVVKSRLMSILLFLFFILLCLFSEFARFG